MSALTAKASVSGVTTGTSKFTILQIKAPANQRVKIKEIGVGFHDTVNTDVPATVELRFQTSAGTMTTISAGYTSGPPITDLASVDQDITETIQTTAQQTATGEPTYGVSAAGPFAVHPQTAIVIPLDGVVVKGGGYIGITILTPASTTADAYIKFEE